MNIDLSKLARDPESGDVMHEVRVALTEIEHGETIVRIGRTYINARFDQLLNVKPGHRIESQDARLNRNLGSVEAGELVMLGLIGRATSPVVRRGAFAYVLRRVA